ncbi:hypothetical protein R1flu_003689 [Riccia fluitans]|uniref:Uncharacterized protein n=1 Tax=Riccia fluitans TaxID=41844 RepID=A0ABD1YAP3_9MARC
MDQLGYHKLQPALFWIGMANGVQVKPMGILSRIPLLVGGLRFKISCVVVHMDENKEDQFILGWPSLRVVKMVHDWKHDVLYIRSGTQSAT